MSAVIHDTFNRSHWSVHTTVSPTPGGWHITTVAIYGNPAMSNGGSASIHTSHADIVDPDHIMNPENYLPRFK